MPERYAGPGGALAVLRDGQVLERGAWGFADTTRRIPFTSSTMFRICSITKQFTCGLVLDLFGDPAALDQHVRRSLPGLRAEPPGAAALCHNQSGLRDYWAVAMLHGAPAEGMFGPQDARRIVAATQTLQFAPGTRYSYANQNFRLLGDIAAERSGRGFAELLRDRLFDPAGMPHALLSAQTNAIPGGTIGYEGTPEIGFRPAVNRIHWTGDAGLAACLDDMIAWEMFIDATRNDPEGLYRRLSAPQMFQDGTPALYGFGLAHGQLAACAYTGHGGGLRGWRSYRLYAPSERLSVVVLFNHMADARDAALALFAAALGVPSAPPSEAPADPGWAGAFLEPETGLAVRIAPAGPLLRLDYGTVPELIDPAASSGTRLSRTADGTWLHRPGDGQQTRLVPLGEAVRPDIEGRFHCEELDATLSIVSAGGVLYGAFSGFLGDGEMQPLLAAGTDVWRLPCPRALDFHAPGDWTLAVHRDSGRASGMQVGCWLARGLRYVRAGSGA